MSGLLAYYPGSFAGMGLRRVAPGTVIKCEETGEELAVTDENAVIKGNVIWCTPKIYAALKAWVGGSS